MKQSLYTRKETTLLNWQTEPMQSPVDPNDLHNYCNCPALSRDRICHYDADTLQFFVVRVFIDGIDWGREIRCQHALSDVEVIRPAKLADVIAPEIKPLKEWIAYLKNHMAQQIKFLVNSNEETREFIIASLMDSQSMILGFERQMRPRLMSAISEEAISRAKEYPIENLIEVKRGMALCVNHQENHASMYCKNNFVYCFSCGFKADSIALYQKIHGVSFKEAVKSLQ